MKESDRDRLALRCEISDMVGLTFVNVVATQNDLTFYLKGGDCFQFYHTQDCCESVCIEEIHGNLEDLIDTPIYLAQEISNENIVRLHEPDESETWTFYKFGTQKGYVTVRWLGESNGYYSESVDLAFYKNKNHRAKSDS
jgi:hypothetical protein